MVTQPRIRMTLEEFERYATLPENVERRLEYIAGEIVEVVSNNASSTVAANVLASMLGFVRVHQLGLVTGADGGYRIAGEDYIPDCAFLSKDKHPKTTRDSYVPIAPDLAVEVLSPANDEGSMRIKIGNYLKAGTLLWVVDPDKKRVEVYAPNQKVRVVELDGTLDGDDVLPNFSMKIADVFYGVE
jgi:Uma2 family endonuclease